MFAAVVLQTHSPSWLTFQSRSWTWSLADASISPYVTHSGYFAILSQGLDLYQNVLRRSHLGHLWLVCSRIHLANLNRWFKFSVPCSDRPSRLRLIRLQQVHTFVCWDNWMKKCLWIDGLQEVHYTVCWQTVIHIGCMMQMITQMKKGGQEDKKKESCGHRRCQMVKKKEIETRKERKEWIDISRRV